MLGVSLDSSGIRVAQARDGSVHTIAVADGWPDGPTGPVRTAWAKCLGRVEPLVNHPRPVTARDIWTALLRRIHTQWALAEPRPDSIVLAVPALHAFRLRPRNDHLSAARRAGFSDAVVVPAAVAVAHHHDQNENFPEDRLVLVVDAGRDTWEVTPLVKQSGRWLLAAPPRDVPELGVWSVARAVVDADTLRDHESEAIHAVLTAVGGSNAVVDGHVVQTEACARWQRDQLPRGWAALGAVCADVSVGEKDVVAVLLVGEAARFPVLRDALCDRFRSAVRLDGCPETLAARGATRWSTHLPTPRLFGESPTPDEVEEPFAVELAKPVAPLVYVP